MKSMIVGMLAETPVHVGAGRSSGFVDLPVARESVTSYPMIPGSGLKGAFRERARRKWPDVKKGENSEKKELSPEVKTLFGVQEGAGNLLISDARLLLLPVRSLTGHFKWVTCPYILERLMRDVARSKADGGGSLIRAIKPPQDGKIFSNGGATGDKMFLEEREFSVEKDLEAGIIDAVKNLMPHDAVRERLEKQLVVMNDDDFNWFAQYGLSVNARNALDEKTKTTKGGALWYEETIPTDSLFYTILFERGAGAVDMVGELFRESSFIQVGGNETVGHGWFSLKVISREG